MPHPVWTGTHRVVIDELAEHEAHDLHGDPRPPVLQHLQERQRGDVRAQAPGPAGLVGEGTTTGWVGASKRGGGHSLSGWDIKGCLPPSPTRDLRPATDQQPMVNVDVHRVTRGLPEDRHERGWGLGEGGEERARILGSVGGVCAPGFMVWGRGPAHGLGGVDGGGVPRGSPRRGVPEAPLQELCEVHTTGLRRREGLRWRSVDANGVTELKRRCGRSKFVETSKGIKRKKSLETALEKNLCRIFWGLFLIFMLLKTKENFK